VFPFYLNFDEEISKYKIPPIIPKRSGAITAICGVECDKSHKLMYGCQNRLNMQLANMQKANANRLPGTIILDDHNKL
jgi:hypothetical protein